MSRYRHYIPIKLPFSLLFHKILFFFFFWLATAVETMSYSVSKDRERKRVEEGEREGETENLSPNLQAIENILITAVSL